MTNRRLTSLSLINLRGPCLVLQTCLDEILHRPAPTILFKYWELFKSLSKTSATEIRHLIDNTHPFANGFDLMGGLLGVAILDVKMIIDKFIDTVLLMFYGECGQD